MIDYDDPQEEERWCNESRERVAEYLVREGLVHGEIGEWPAWHIAPYISIWAIESVKSPGWVGWWVIAGEICTDYMSAEKVKHPRDAMRYFGEQWREVAKCMMEGKSHPSIEIGTPEDWPKLGSVLNERAEKLIGCADDESFWIEE